MSIKILLNMSIQFWHIVEELEVTLEGFLLRSEDGNGASLHVTRATFNDASIENGALGVAIPDNDDEEED